MASFRQVLIGLSKDGQGEQSAENSATHSLTINPPTLHQPISTSFNNTPIPRIEEVFAEIRREESRRKIMLNDGRNTQSEAAALYTSRKDEQNRNNTNEQRRPKKGNLWCVFCQKTNHTREICWKIHGKPGNQQNRETQRYSGRYQRETRAYQATLENLDQKQGDPIGGLNLSREQLELLHKLLNPEKPTGTALIAQQGPGLGEEDWQC